jgi:sortase A
MLVHVTVHQPMVRGSMRKLLLWLSNVLLLGGIAAMLAGAGALLDGMLYQSVQKLQMEEVVNDLVDRGAATPASAPQPVSPLRALLPKAVLPKRDPLGIGELEVPRLGMDVVMREGVDDASLRKAVGHLPSSALPGEAGNVVLLGHRDTFFRPLREITRGDEIRVRVAGRSFVFNVQSVQVTEPDWPGAVERTRRFLVRAKLEH